MIVGDHQNTPAPSFLPYTTIDHNSKYCDTCRSSHAPQDAICNHCGKGFVVPPGTQIKCKQSGWDLPKKCSDCRELFKHKPFKTVKETRILGSAVFRTYNSLGQLISESRDEKAIFGNDRRRHTNPIGNTTGFTRNKETVFGTPYRETTRPDGSVKSRSTEKTSIFGTKYTESTGGSSQATHKTTSEKTWWGKMFRKTE
jgi:hypothetical protein